jgi:hypothetical protein
MGTIKYGFVYGTRCQIPVVLGGSEVFKDLSGCFTKFELTVDTEGRPQVVPAGNGDSILAGWIDVAEYTSGTDGLDEAMLDVSSLSVYRMPVGAGTLALADVGDYCDLVVASNIQGLNVAEGAEGTLIIVKRESASVALVRMNPSKITGAAAADDA